MMNKIITSEGNVQFQTADGKIINVHPFHVYTVFNEDTVSFLLIAMPKSSGLAIFTSKAEDLEVDGTVYTIDELPNALSEAFAKAGAVARYEIVDELPTSGQSNTIYLVPKSEGIGYDEYIYVNGAWELIGDTDIELDRYVDKETFSGYTADTLVLINTVSGNVITESERAISAETALQTAIDNEVSARTADIEALSGAVDNVQDEVDILSAALEDEVSARTEADSALQGLIDTVSGNVETEVSRATSAETELQTTINNEVSARTDADTALGNKIDGKVVELTQAQYDSLQDKDPLVLYVITDAVEVNMNDYYKKTETSGATELSTAFANETSARTDADAALSASKANKSEAVASAEYVSSSTTIDLKDISGNVISQVDASDFIIDGMVDDVRIETISGETYLVIDFNTASGKEDIQIPISDIFDASNYYTKAEVDAMICSVDDYTSVERVDHIGFDNSETLLAKDIFISSDATTLSVQVTARDTSWQFPLWNIFTFDFENHTYTGDTLGVADITYSASKDAFRLKLTENYQANYFFNEITSQDGNEFNIDVVTSEIEGGTPCEVISDSILPILAEHQTAINDKVNSVGTESSKNFFRIFSTKGSTMIDAVTLNLDEIDINDENGEYVVRPSIKIPNETYGWELPTSFRAATNITSYGNNFKDASKLRFTYQNLSDNDKNVTIYLYFVSENSLVSNWLSVIFYEGGYSIIDSIQEMSSAFTSTYDNDILTIDIPSTFNYNGEDGHFEVHTISVSVPFVTDSSDGIKFESYGELQTPLKEYVIGKLDASAITAYSTSAEVTAEINAATSGKVNTSDFETYSGNVETALNSKLDATAYTPTDLSNYYTKDETSGATEITTALNGKANTTDIYTYIDGRGIKVQSASGTRRKSINLNVPVYSGSAVAAVSCNNESGSGNGLNHISGVTSFGAGWMVKTQNQTEAAFGTNNTTNQVNGGGAWGAEYVSGNTLFSVGNGNNSNAHNAFEIRQNGDIYITSGGTDASWYSKPMVKLQDALGQGGISSGEVQTMIDNSISGKVDTSDFETYSGTVDSRLAENEEVTASGLNALNDKFGGLKLMKISQSAYDSLQTKDNNTLYIISD